MPSAVDFPAVRTALAALDPTALGAVQRVALLAWLEGWKHHWPSRFDREIGAVGNDLVRRLREHPSDPNRYLKLRRIAVENLASAL